MRNSSLFFIIQIPKIIFVCTESKPLHPLQKFQCVRKSNFRFSFFSRILIIVLNEKRMKTLLPRITSEFRTSAVAPVSFHQRTTKSNHIVRKLLHLDHEHKEREHQRGNKEFERTFLPYTSCNV